MYYRFLALCAALFIGAFLPVMASASPPYSYPGARMMLAERKPLSLDQAVHKVQRALGGRVLAAGTVKKDGQVYYRIKILTAKGVVRVVLVNPVTGKVL